MTLFANILPIFEKLRKPIANLMEHFAKLVKQFEILID